MEAKQVGALIFSAAAIYAAYRFFDLPKEERRSMVSNIRERTGDLLEDADNTVEKVHHYFSELKNTQPGNWIDKIYLLRKMFTDFYGKPAIKRIALVPGVSQAV